MSLNVSVCLRVWCVCACDLSSIRSHHADTLDTLHSAPSSSVATFLSPALNIPSLPLFICCLPKSSALFHQFTTCASCGRHLQLHTICPANQSFFLPFLPLLQLPDIALVFVATATSSEAHTDRPARPQQSVRSICKHIVLS